MRLTDARRRGLEALLAVHPYASGRRSNKTLVGYVCWQTADWLIREGLAEWTPGSYQTYLRLTGRGLELAKREQAWKERLLRAHAYYQRKEGRSDG